MWKDCPFCEGKGMVQPLEYGKAKVKCHVCAAHFKHMEQLVALISAALVEGGLPKGAIAVAMLGQAFMDATKSVAVGS